MPGVVQPDALYARSVLLEELDDALDELPDEQREVFVGHEIEGRSFKQMAAETGASVNTLLSRKRYAVLHLRERLQAYHAERKATFVVIEHQMEFVMALCTRVLVLAEGRIIAEGLPQDIRRNPAVIYCSISGFGAGKGAALPGYDIVLYQGILAPGKTPRNIVVKLNGEINRLLARPASKEAWANIGAEILIVTPEEMDARFRQEVAKLAKIAIESGARID